MLRSRQGTVVRHPASDRARASGQPLDTLRPMRTSATSNAAEMPGRRRVYHATTTNVTGDSNRIDSHTAQDVHHCSLPDKPRRSSSRSSIAKKLSMRCILYKYSRFKSSRHPILPSIAPRPGHRDRQGSRIRGKLIT